MTVLLEQIHLARLASYFLCEAIQAAIEPRGVATRVGGQGTTRDVYASSTPLHIELALVQQGLAVFCQNGFRRPLL